MRLDSRAMDACPCGRRASEKADAKTVAYAQCCGRFVDDWNTPAPDAEHLMRSRYSAFALQRADYLLATWHASTRPALLDFETGARWLGLEVLAHKPGPGPDAAVVRFVARYRVAGKAVRLAETSRFVREAGDEGEAGKAGKAGATMKFLDTAQSPLRWFYVDGDLA